MVAYNPSQTVFNPEADSREEAPMARRQQSIPEPAGDGGRDEAAEFIAQMVGDLLAVAQRHRLETLAFLLDMAKMEAEELVRAAALGRQALSPARRRG